MGLIKLTWQSTAAAALTVGAFGLAPLLGTFGGWIHPDSTFELMLDEAAERTVAMVVPMAQAAPLPDLVGSEGGAGTGAQADGGEEPGPRRVAARPMDRPGEGARAMARSATKAAPVKAEPAAKRTCEADDNPYIQRTAGGKFQVDRDVIKTYTRNWAALNDLGWSRPFDGDDGTPDGMLVGGVECGSDLHDAGIRSGDVIHSVNGIAIRSIPEALLAYGKLKKDDLLKVRITRRGHEKVLTYRMQD